MNLVVDAARLRDNWNSSSTTGIYVRALHEGKWGSYDIINLDKVSLLTWLRSRGGDNKWAENVVGILLGYDGPLHDKVDVNG